MKINSFDLNLNSTRQFTQTYSSQTVHEFSFVNYLDTMEHQQGQEPAALTQGSLQNSTSPWYEPVVVGGGQGVSLSDQFISELGKMRRIMAAVMETFEQTLTQGCQCSLDKIHQVSALPGDQTRAYPYAAWRSTRTETFVESEYTRVSARGAVRTADNREIDFSLDLEMARTFLSQSYFSATQTGYAFEDPLIVSSDQTAPALSGAGFSFDLNKAGSFENLPLPEPGFGFLSLDLNHDGRINEAKELFGPSTGDGFKELAAYDLDQNNWIDENDPIFDELTLWENVESKGMTLTRLKDAGIGAIYLAGVDTPFDLKNQENELLARVKKTSIALGEDGEVLPVQELDYTV